MSLLEFASHISCGPGQQALAYIDTELKHTGIKIARITGGDPCPPSGAHLFIEGPVSFRYAHPYVHELSPSKRTQTDTDATLMCFLIACMDWTLRADMIYIVNPRHLTGSKFVGIHEANYHNRLRQLCEMVASAVH